MMVALSGNSAVSQLVQASAQQTTQAVSSASPSADRTTAQDTVTISAQGQQASRAAQAQGSDGDGDAS